MAGDIAAAMATAHTPEERQDAQRVFAAYYTARPISESAAERMSILYFALLAHLRSN